MYNILNNTYYFGRALVASFLRKVIFYNLSKVHPTFPADCSIIKAWKRHKKRTYFPNYNVS